MNRAWSGATLRESDSGWARCCTLAAGRALRFGVFVGLHSYRAQDPSARARELLLEGDVSPEQACRSALRSVGAQDGDPDFVSGLQFALADIDPNERCATLAWIGAPAVVALSSSGARLVNEPHLLGRKADAPPHLRHIVTRGISSPSGDETADRLQVDLRGDSWILVGHAEPSNLASFASALPESSCSPRLMASAAAALLIDEGGDEAAVVAVDLEALWKSAGP